MEIKKKYMNKKNWSRVIDKEYISMFFKEQNISGVASLTFIKNVTSPLIIKYKDNIKTTLVDKDYYWLQLGIENENYWITAMYDNNKKIIQYYIDITEKNIIDEHEKAFFYDLFLDVVILNTGEMFLLDEDELKEALNEKVINKEQYELANKKAKEIIQFISKDKRKLEYICDKFFYLLLSKMENDN